MDLVLLQTSNIKFTHMLSMKSTVNVNIKTMNEDQYPALPIMINDSISLGKGADIISYIVSTMCCIIHFLFQQFDLLVVVLQ